jgi:hypothetical protein
MSYVEAVKKDLAESGKWFKAEPLKVYTLRLINVRRLEEGDKFYKPDSSAYEITLLDWETNKEKVWTTGSVKVMAQLVGQDILEGDTFELTRTGDNKNYWKIKKVDAPVQPGIDVEQVNFV